MRMGPFVLCVREDELADGRARAKPYSDGSALRGSVAVPLTAV